MASKLLVVLCACFAAANAGYLGASVATYAAAPSPYSYAAAAPVATYAAPAPYSYAAAAPVVRYSPANVVSHSYSSIGAPAALAYAAPAYAAPAYAAQTYAAPAYAAQAYAAPAYATQAYAAPVAKAYYGPGTVAVSSPAIGSTQQNIVRSFGGTVSQYSKAVDTAFSSVRKYDTRINNNVYTPAIAKTLAYAPAQAVVSHAAPAYLAHSAPGLVAAAPASAYATKAISYSPAGAVAHVSFDGLGVHYGW